MKARHEQDARPSVGDGRARLGVVKTPRTARPRSRRADGLDDAGDEPRRALTDGRVRPWPEDVGPLPLRLHDAMLQAPTAPSIVVTIGHETHAFHAFVTAAPIAVDAPATVTLYTSTWSDLSTFVDAEAAFELTPIHTAARLVLVDSMELTWQRARYRKAGHQLLPADGGLVGQSTLQRWLWRRLFENPFDEVENHGRSTSPR